MYVITVTCTAINKKINAIFLHLTFFKFLFLVLFALV